MFLSDRDLLWAIEHGQLIVDPPAKAVGSTSIDLTLDSVEEAKVWNIPKFREHNRDHGLGDEPTLPLGTFNYKAIAAQYLMQPRKDPADLVYRKEDSIVIKPQGFVLWQTKERVGTPEEGAQLICFVDGKSTRSRTGLLVHLTAPTIHAGWGAWPVTLEIANLGPFHFVLREGDSIAQITVATISSIPERSMREAGSITSGQTTVGISPSEGKNTTGQT